MIVQSSLRTAINNWLWLAELPNMRDALVVGEYLPHVKAGLEKHFEEIRVHSLTGDNGLSLPFEPQSFDCIVFDDVIGEGLVSNTVIGGLQLLAEVRRVVRLGGCVFLPVKHLARRRPHRLARPLRRAGFAEIRPVYVYESFDRPDTMIPARQRTATFFESWAWGGVRGKARAAVALAGAHHLTQPSLFFLAYP